MPSKLSVVSFEDWSDWLHHSEGTTCGQSWMLEVSGVRGQPGPSGGLLSLLHQGRLLKWLHFCWVSEHFSNMSYLYHGLWKGTIVLYKAVLLKLLKVTFCGKLSDCEMCCSEYTTGDSVLDIIQSDVCDYLGLVVNGNCLFTPEFAVVFSYMGVLNENGEV